VWWQRGKVLVLAINAKGEDRVHVEYPGQEERGEKKTRTGK
jgi:hypothetical protein